MPAMTLVKSGKRYTHEEWLALSNDDRDDLLSKFGPAYTDEAWRRHMGTNHGKLRK